MSRNRAAPTAKKAGSPVGGCPSVGSWGSVVVVVVVVVARSVVGVDDALVGEVVGDWCASWLRVAPRNSFQQKLADGCSVRGKATIRALARQCRAKQAAAAGQQPGRAWAKRGGPLKNAGSRPPHTVKTAKPSRRQGSLLFFCFCLFRIPDIDGCCSGWAVDATATTRRAVQD